MATDSGTTYDASTYYSDPGVNNVLTGTTYSYGGTNNKSGDICPAQQCRRLLVVTYGVSGGTTGGWPARRSWTPPTARSRQPRS